MAIDFEYPEYMFDKTDAGLLENFVKEKKEILKSKRIMIFGAGVRGTIFGILLKKIGIDTYDYCDNHDKKWGATLGGHIILSPVELEKRRDEYNVLVSIESRELVEIIEKQLQSMGFVKGDNLFSLPSKIYDNYIETFKEKKNNHVLILGDCRFTFVSIYDENIVTLDDMLKKGLEEKNIEAKVLSMHALCMRPQYYILKRQLELGYIPKRIVLPINYETYNGTTHLLSSSQHAELMRRIHDDFQIPDDELKDYVKLAWERTNNPPFVFSVEQENGSPLVSDKKLRLFLRMSYMYEPDMEGEGIVYLKKTLEMLNAYNVKILAFVPPVNYMSGKEYWGDEFIEKYTHGIGVFEKIVRSYGADFMDQSFLLTEEGFYSKYDKNEIANYEGRVIMSKSLMEAIEKYED